MRVLATAGHVDHGKSTLVRALTGMEPDRLEEERRRGLTIELGFAWTRLGTEPDGSGADPGASGGEAGTSGGGSGGGSGNAWGASGGERGAPGGSGGGAVGEPGSSGSASGHGADGERGAPGGFGGASGHGAGGGFGGEAVAFVDVPGHERLVGTMLAGVGPVPAVVFVVAADQGWQRQSQEHLAILDTLGVRHGLLVVTRADLADAATAARVRDDALGRLAATSLGEVEAVRVSGVTGEGLDEVRAALVRLAAKLPAPDRDADVRLWVDRVFTVQGRGTVVTGTLGAGTVAVGDRLQPDGGGDPVRVRGLQSLKDDRDEVGAVARVAVNVRGGAGEVRRGAALLSPGRWLTTGVVDVRVRGDAARDLPGELTLHAGTAAVRARVRPLGADTARLTLARPLPLRAGDVALLRDPGPHRVAGVTVLDVRPERFARRGAAAARARELAALTGPPDGAAELRRRGLITRAELAAMGFPVPAEPVAGDWLADPGHWAALRERLVRAVEEHAARHPTDPGLPAEAARRALGLPDRALVAALAAGTPLRRRDGRLYGGAAVPALPPAVRAAVDAVRRDLKAAPFRAPEAGRLAELGLTPRLLAAAAAAGALLRLGDGIVLLPGDDERAAGLLAGLGGPFTLSDARRALGTTRRVAVPLMEHLDARGYTERVDELRRRCRAHTEGAS